MIKILVQVCGDHWINPTQVAQQLNETRQEKRIVLDLQTEGPSLEALGILQMVTQHCQEINRPLKDVYIMQWPNAVESVPFQHIQPSKLSHFFWLSNRYSIDEPPAPTHQHRFGLFVGRKTYSRAAMLKWAVQHPSKQFLVSCMDSIAPAPWQTRSPGHNLETASDWLSDDFYSWWPQCGIGSLDQHSVQQQYQPEYNTNRDLLTHYGKFDIELVAETYTLGTTFFPTEKTVRPIVGLKPFVIYGPIDHLKNLKKLGFKTYDDFWDESYDQYQGVERWKKIQQVIDQILQMPTADVLACAEVAKHNKQQLQILIQKHRPQ